MSTNGIRREGGEQGSRLFHWCGGSIEGDEKAEEEEGAYFFFLLHSRASDQALSVIEV